ncbi:hypothetical protein [Pimelobacter simplex]|uniref:Uncharacterized protein n=1 Tax=Nocardioides simplex TaxID=2045 RepID=A0A0A1DX48_NOCSI|nr:hypothetical protein [Pimelobacter simplex]AIY20015.2 hypothetical protein KR76_17855 [Pimelobacter simplex]GEB15759.1 hypothetical protein NSI01_40740 [Pimelobacter simplex]SFN10440.1 hypothetical protein SAMN05421671_5167 [Pimelobacter simplex]
MAESKDERDEKVTRDAGTPGASAAPSRSRSLAVARVRDIVARGIWIVCMVLALVLAIAAFTYALEANSDNGLVKLARHLADVFDLGFFDLDNPVKAFDDANDPNGAVKTALFNYGLGAVVYLVLGRILERIIRP